MPTILIPFLSASLGDRHCENILLDSNTGDVVHVDFNCLFEKVNILHFITKRVLCFSLNSREKR
jgi:Phosphatidylinositol 3- and 4-kinase